MDTIAQIQNCCGCRACEQVCPKKCITFVTDSEGFYIPSVNESECVNCGKCIKTCAQKGYHQLRAVRETYAALHNNHDILMDSTSGGGMTSIAEIILNHEGIVYGAFLDKSDWKVKFTGIEDIASLHKLRGSKYVQSDTGNVYAEIKKQLNLSRDVLFIGVPCQVAGLYSFLGNNNTEHLLTIDILCHGTPSPELFIKHVNYLERKYHKKLTGFSFRDKTKFPNKTALRYEFGNKKLYVLGRCEYYFNAFISGSAYRMCCYDCQYATSKRVGDITLGDYWGIRKFHPDFDNSCGVSLMLVNSEKGEKFLNSANLKLLKSDIEKASVGNGILKGPSQMAKCRKWFYQDVNTIGYEAALKKNIKIKNIFYNWILTHLPSGIIKFLSKI